MVAAVLDRSSAGSSAWATTRSTSLAADDAGHAGPDGTLVRATGEPVRARFVLAPCSVDVAGRVVARGANGRLTLVRTDGEPLRARAGDC